ncbi:MAG: hypothetical protein QM737_23695 [Ferruginibacter sp.]
MAAKVKEINGIQRGFGKFYKENLPDLSILGLKFTAKSQRRKGIMQNLAPLRLCGQIMNAIKALISPPYKIYFTCLLPGGEVFVDSHFKNLQTIVFQVFLKTSNLPHETKFCHYRLWKDR